MFFVPQQETRWPSGDASSIGGPKEKEFTRRSTTVVLSFKKTP
jgi:hypothetical protein